MSLSNSITWAKSATLLFVITLISCEVKEKSTPLSINVVETSASGAKLQSVNPPEELQSSDTIRINLKEKFQKITGFGGAFTQSSAHLLQQLSPQNQKEIIDSYFSEDGAHYSLTRTHMNSCDFSTEHYSYADIEDDTTLEHFSIQHDLADVIPMINAAKKASKDGFKILASPWTAPIWMKDNHDWNGGKLLPKYYSTWAKFFSKYHQAYAAEGIDIWGFTVENEPLGNDANWESMHYTPEEMGDFVKNHLGPQLEADNIDANILVYDQNRGKELEEWAEHLLTDPDVLKYTYGTAVHWYTSTVDWMPNSLQFVHKTAPDKAIIHTEGCIDAEVPHWKDDEWYWKKEATDWGFDWAPEEDKADHPKYVPAYRYARDMIGCMNNWVEGWIDWNMVLDRQGGPNLASNWCIAPIIVDVEADEVYKTPLFYVMSHFSKYVRPEATVLNVQLSNKNLMATAAQNIDGSVVLIVLNMNETAQTFNIELEGKNASVSISPKAIQTITIESTKTIDNEQ